MDRGLVWYPLASTSIASEGSRTTLRTDVLYLTHLCFFLCLGLSGDDYASEWSYLSNRLRSAARLAQPKIGTAATQGSPVTFGGAIVPRAGTDGRKANKTGSSVGTPDLLMRALTLVGNGAKHLWWFAFGSRTPIP